MRAPPVSKRWSRSGRVCGVISPGSRPPSRGLKLRHDHGSLYMSDHFQKEIAFLGIESSPAFVRAPEGNGCAERFIRTLKENLL
jgi:transposase InsO family protein